MAALPLDRHAGITVEQYFALEASSEIRREFYHGDLIARIGMSFNHNLITSNVGASLNIQLQHRAECVALVSAMRVQVSEAVYFYPDVLAACDAQYSDDDRDVLLNPCAVIEVASENSALYDRVTKLDAYKRMPSVQEILIIDQHRVWIE